MSYGVSIEDIYTQIGRYAGAIFKGGNPADMPIVTSVKYDGRSTFGLPPSLDWPSHRRCWRGPTR